MEMLPGEGLISEGRRGRKPGASHSSEKLSDLLETVAVLQHFLHVHREFCKNLSVVNSFQHLFWKFTLEIYTRWTLHMYILLKQHNVQNPPSCLERNDP